jgi:hypothetical protein
MKIIISLFLLWSISNCAFGQYGSLELNSGGFSFIPAFTDKNPNLMINAGTNSNHWISGHLIANFSIPRRTARNTIFITRFKILDRRLRWTAGLHLPAFQLNEDHTIDRFFAQEINLAYQLSKKVNFGLFYLHGMGRNLDFNANFLSWSTTVKEGNFVFITQMYVLDLGQVYGISQNINFVISDKFTAKGFLNKTLSDGTWIGTVGLSYNL